MQPFVFKNYGKREETRANHRRLAIDHFGLKYFEKTDFKMALDVATQASFGTDDGTLIMHPLLCLNV